MTTEIQTKDGLLWRDGKMIPLPEADAVAIAAGFTCAERMVKALELKLPAEKPAVDIRKGKTSASNALADSLCPGRFTAQLGMPDVKGEWAESGSHIHAALAENAREGVNSGAVKSLTLEERETFDACREIEKRKVLEFFGPAEERSPQGVNGEGRIKVFREKPDGSSRLWGKVPILPKLYKPLSQAYDGVEFLKHSGQPDVIFRCGVKALICEYKTLAGDVADSSRNLQLRDQAVLTRGNVALLEEIGTVVIQPFVTHNPEICLYTKADLDRAEREMWARVAQSNDPNSPRVAGKPQCDYCLAKTKCLEYAQWAGSQVPVINQDLFSVAMANWTPEQRALAANALAPAGKMLEEIAEFLKSGCSQDPAFVPGWVLEPGNERETIIDLKTLFQRFVALGGKEEQFVAAASITKKNLRQAVSELTGARGKALDTSIGLLTKNIVEVKQNKPSLKKVSQ